MASKFESLPKEKQDRLTADIERLMDRFAPEDLDEELEQYREVSRTGFDMIRHPLVFSVPHMDAMNKSLNQQLQFKKKAIEKALKDKKYSTYVFTYERPYRLHAFTHIEEELRKNPKEYWKLLHDVWIDSEFPYVNKSVWTRLFKADIPHKEYFMNKEDRATLKKLPKEITIYRGYKGNFEKGISWTLDKDEAQWFADRFAGKGTPKVVSKTLPKEKVFAYTNQRNEKEIIYLN